MSIENEIQIFCSQSLMAIILSNWHTYSRDENLCNSSIR